MQAEGAIHIRERAVGPSRALWRRALVVRGTIGRLRLTTRSVSWGAARDGLPCVPLLGSREPRVTCPGPLRERTSRRNCERATPPQAGHRPCPASAAQLMRPLASRIAIMIRAARSAGISFARASERFRPQPSARPSCPCCARPAPPGRGEVWSERVSHPVVHWQVCSSRHPLTRQRSRPCASTAHVRLG
jgi:hypothetical protein